jgi:hypothetical protein
MESKLTVWRVPFVAAMRRVNPPMATSDRAELLMPELMANASSIRRKSWTLVPATSA